MNFVVFIIKVIIFKLNIKNQIIVETANTLILPYVCNLVTFISNLQTTFQNKFFREVLWIYKKILNYVSFDGFPVPRLYSIDILNSFEIEDGDYINFERCRIAQFRFGQWKNDSEKSKYFYTQKISFYNFSKCNTIINVSSQYAEARYYPKKGA